MLFDENCMKEALALAEQGRGAVEPNPLVGAVIVRDGQIVGRGFHRRFGEAHAEVNALAEAGEKARGGTLYVTLEPCCHHGKTPPCTDAILQARLKRIVIATGDPFPQVASGGIAALRAAGLNVEIGLWEAEARKLNAPYLKLLQTGQPWVHLKWAMTLDGRIATHGGESKWITGEESRSVVHQLRGRMDAILVGRGTVLADDPLLTARPPGPRTAARVIVTFSGDLPTNCQLRRTARDAPVIVYTAAGTEERLAGWAADGAEIVGLPVAGAGVSPLEILKDLGRRRFTNVFVEGGPGLLGRFFDAGAADEVHAFIAPKLVGGDAALGPIGGFGLKKIADAIALTDTTVKALGPDFYLNGTLLPRRQ
jgi:diaminohydroxyphosphoribosylaminopyrimidine deaminase/5-amino-6-(5-phosphoribosylamino)uracil reductase